MSIPQGNVVIDIGNNNTYIGRVTLDANGSGIVTFPYNPSYVPSQPLTLTYNPTDGYHMSSTAVATENFNPPPNPATKINITATPNPASFGDTITVNFTVVEQS